MTETRPKVGIGVLIFRDGKVLLGDRMGSFGALEFAGTGGHLEYMESIVKCAERETLEETGMEIEDVQFLCLVNLKQYAPRHYVDIGLTARWKSGEPLIMEPGKIRGWNWYELDNLPQPLFGSVTEYFQALKSGRHFFDS